MNWIKEMCARVGYGDCNCKTYMAVYLLVPNGGVVKYNWLEENNA